MPVRILYVGRFDPVKNIGVMMEGLCLAASTLSCNIVLLGDGPLRGPAQKLVAQRGLGAKFDFRGYEDPPWEEMRQASMLLLVSRHEGHPNVVCEAMAVGCPVVISDIPAHRALFSEQNAWLVDPDSPENIAAVVHNVAAHPSEALRRVAEGERLVSKWSPEAIAGRYLGLYMQLCNGDSPRV
jgi:glycosyltransferase involved in cell wall biosynthesis